MTSIWNFYFSIDFIKKIYRNIQLPGCPIGGLGAGAPSCQVQSGSPNSSPFFLPSPSESLLQRVAVQDNPAAIKSYKNSLV